MAENELRKHLRTALDAQSVGLNTEELTRFVKHLEKHGVTVGAAPKAKAKAKPRKKAAPKATKAQRKADEKKIAANPKPHVGRLEDPKPPPKPDLEVTSTFKPTWSIKPKEKN